MADLFGDDTPQQKGGKARAEKLSPEARKDIARRAASARWATEASIPKATHGSATSRSGSAISRSNATFWRTAFECSPRGAWLQGLALRAAGRGAKAGDPDSGGAEIPRFAGQTWIKDHISNDLVSALKTPILFRLPSGGKAYGYPATILADICDAVLDARTHGKTTQRQAVIVHRCEILMRGFARVGIVALVDEATGYQEIREKALEEILNAT